MTCSMSVKQKSPQSSQKNSSINPLRVYFNFWMGSEPACGAGRDLEFLQKNLTINYM